MRNRLLTAVFLFVTISRADFVVMTKDLNTTTDDLHWRRIGIQVNNQGDQILRLDTMEAVYSISDTSNSLQNAVWYFQSHSADWKYSIQGTAYVTIGVNGTSLAKEVH